MEERSVNGLDRIYLLTCLFCKAGFIDYIKKNSKDNLGINIILNHYRAGFNNERIKFSGSA